MVDVQKRLGERYGFLIGIGAATLAGVALAPQYASSILMAGFLGALLIILNEKMNVVDEKVERIENKIDSLINSKKGRSGDNLVTLLVILVIVYIIYLILKGRGVIP